MTDYEGMRAMLIGLSVVGVASFVVIAAVVWVYDRRRDRKERREIAQHFEKRGLL